jgi:Leucine-rich repeat (LRR) protein
MKTGRGVSQIHCLTELYLGPEAYILNNDINKCKNLKIIDIRYNKLITINGIKNLDKLKYIYTYKSLLTLEYLNNLRRKGVIAII